MSHPTVIITAPHSLCSSDFSKNYHYCDFASRRVAISLHQQLLNDGIPTLLYLASVLRPICDLNRSPCRNQSFRPPLSQDLESPDVQYVLDIHSYPYLHNFKDSELALLDWVPSLRSWEGISAHNDHGYNQLAIDLYNYLRGRGVNVNLFHGSEANDIIVTAKLREKEAILIEYFEDLSDNRINQINQMISDFLVEHMTSTSVSRMI